MTTKQSEKPKTKKQPAKKNLESSKKETTEYKRAAKSEENSAQSRKENREHEEKVGKTARVRIFPVWLRIIIVGILSIAALVVGLMIGFGVIGDGTPTDALKVETWQHILDIVIKNE